MPVATQTPIKVERVLECDEVCAFLESLGEDAVVALDTEGTNIELDYRDGSGYGTGISLAFRFGQVLGGYYPVRHPADNLEPEQFYRLANAIRNFKGWFVFHNAKHDLVALKTLGINYEGKFYDTLLLCHLLNEELPFAGKRLNDCCKHYLGQDSKKNDQELKVILAALNQQWHLVPANIMGPYAVYDAALTLALFEHVFPRVSSEIAGFDNYWAHKQDFIRVIIAMESRGVRVDTALCERQAAIGETQMEEIKEILGYNPGSPKDLKILLIDKLGLPVVKTSKKTGAPSFDKTAMEQYDQMLEFREDPTAALVLGYRGWQKAVSSNYRPYVALLSPDGRLRPNYKLHGTKTGRMSCEKPNLQQIPRVSDKPWNGSMKSAFIPEDGYTLHEFDYSQLEFRLGAAYAAQFQKDLPLINIFNDPTRDVFTEMSLLENWDRQKIKTRTYTIQFGGGANRLKNVFGLSTLEEGEAIKRAFFDTYPGFEKVMKMASSKARTKGKLQLWSGRYRHFLYPSDEAHKGFNAVIQGGAADIMNHVMVRLHKEIDNDDECRMLLQVHDSVVFEIKNGCEDKYYPRIKEIMEDVKPDFGVKFAVDGHRWGE